MKRFCLLAILSLVAVSMAQIPIPNSGVNTTKIATKASHPTIDTIDAAAAKEKICSILDQLGSGEDIEGDAVTVYVYRNTKTTKVATQSGTRKVSDQEGVAKLQETISQRSSQVVVIRANVIKNEPKEYTVEIKPAVTKPAEKTQRWIGTFTPTSTTTNRASQ